MKLSASTAYNMLVFVIWPSGCLLLGILGVTWHWIFAVLLFAFMFLLDHLTRRIRCPKCGTPVGWHRYAFAGLEFEWWSPLARRRCEHCGHDLAASERGDPR
jgi:DNA-directed RNA polymerase subunit RPC12/RpoP